MKHINTEKEYIKALDRIDELMALEPPPKSQEGHELTDLCEAVDKYEDSFNGNDHNSRYNKYDE